MAASGRFRANGQTTPMIMAPDIPTVSAKKAACPACKNRTPLFPSCLRCAGAFFRARSAPSVSPALRREPEDGRRGDFDNTFASQSLIEQQLRHEGRPSQVNTKPLVFLHSSIYHREALSAVIGARV